MTLHISLLQMLLNGHLMLNISWRYVPRAQFCQPAVFRKCVVSNGTYWMLQPNGQTSLPSCILPVSRTCNVVGRICLEKPPGLLMGESFPQEATMQYHTGWGPQPPASGLVLPLTFYTTLDKGASISTVSS